jgi:RNA polymerase sigma-70 factor (ECF subfamily)
MGSAAAVIACTQSESVRATKFRPVVANSAANRRVLEADGTAQRRLAAAMAHDLDRHFEAFVVAYQDRLFGFVLTLVGNAAEAEEVAQDAFVSAYNALRTYDAQRIRALSLRAWLFTIALNKVRNRARKRPGVSLDDARAGGFDPAGDGSEWPEVAVERDERIAALRSALERLAPRYRVPVLLRHIEGFSYEEIAAAIGQPVGTAKSNVHRGLALLRASGNLMEIR